MPTTIDRQMKCDLLALLLDSLSKHSHWAVRFTAKELAQVIDVSSGDILEMTKDVAYRWLIAGEEFRELSDFYHRLNEGGHMVDSEYVEIEFLRNDCGGKLVAALLGDDR